MAGGGGGGRRDGEAGARIGSGNVFAALEALKKKKKKPPPSSSSSSSSAVERKGKGVKKLAPGEGNVPPAVFWAPAPLKSKSWADVGDEDDDDYFATTAPPRPVWGTAPVAAGEVKAGLAGVLEEETESEDDGLDVYMGDDEPEEELEHEHEVDIPSEHEFKTSAPVPVHSKDTAKQLSKKELKKKELAELDAVLAELGISGSAMKADVTSNCMKSERKSDEQNGDGDKNGPPLPSENKTSKKKKSKKEKSSKDSKEQPNEVDSGKDHGEAADTKSEEETTAVSAVDMKEKMKKLAAAKRKKSSKEVDAAAKHAALEPAARSAKLAAAKKKEKNHYNQQPVR